MKRVQARPDAGTSARILVVDDAPDTLELVQRNLASQGYEVVTATSAADAIPLLDASPLDLVITDVRMPGMSGMDLIREAHARHPEIEIMVITGYPTVEGAVEALQVGAWDYLPKPFTDDELFGAVRRALARRQGARPAPAGVALLEFHGLLGRSKVMHALFEALAAAGRATSPVLLRGEPGSGREAAARALHLHAGRGGAFLRSSLDAGLVVPPGADAARFVADLAASCPRGTLYLAGLDGAREDVLRGVSALVGRAKGTGPRARIVASMVADPQELARRGPTMAALLDELGAAVTIPPLRERGEDVVLLARRFLADTATASGVPIRALAPETEGALRVHAWPGNVRELADLCRQLVLSGRTGAVGTAELPAGILAGAATRDDTTLAAAEREHIARVLRSAGGNKSRAAAILGIDRKTLRDKLR